MKQETLAIDVGHLALNDNHRTALPQPLD